MKNSKCCLCGSSEFDVLYSYDQPDKYAGFVLQKGERYYRELRVCLKCSHVFNVQSECKIENVYNEFWSKDLHGEKAEDMFYRIASLPPHKSENLPRIEWLKRHLANIGKNYDVFKGNPKKVLDIGCGLGIFLNAFIDDEWQGYGVEPSRHGCAVVEKILKMPVVCGHYCSGLFKEQFDFITLIHVLEHIADPVQFLADVRNDLMPRGVVFIEVPEIMELRYSSKECEACNSGHYHLFSPGTLLSILEQAGFIPLIIEREVSPRPRRRIKVLAIMDDWVEGSGEKYFGCAKKLINFRNDFIRSTDKKE